MNRTNAGRAIGVTLATVAVAFAAPAAGEAAPGSPAAHTAATTRAGCAATVTIAAKRVCLRVGTSCQRRYERRYNSKGFTCRRTASGSYKLKRVAQEF